LDIATNFASGEEAVGAIFHDTKGKEKRQEARTNEAPDPKRSAGSFEPVKGVKEVPLDPSSSSSKTVRVGTALDPK
jgi:hypothetical protein